MVYSTGLQGGAEWMKSEGVRRCTFYHSSRQDKTLRLLRASLLLSAFISAQISADLLEFELGIAE